MHFALDESETLCESSKDECIGPYSPSFPGNGRLFEIESGKDCNMIWNVKGIQSAPWSPSCLHECWCHETSVISVTNGWKPSVNRTRSSTNSLNNDVFRTAICVQQHDTDIDALLASLPAQTEVSSKSQIFI